MSKNRLDKEMLKRELVRSRSQATAFINQGQVLVNGKEVSKPGVEVTADDLIVITVNPDVVGRGAYKLEHALDAFKLDPKGKRCADFGASTGGFTQVLLKRGAIQVVAIDVGHDQLDQSLIADKRVLNWEGMNLREIQALPFEVSFAVVDLSFISITKVMEKIKSLLVAPADVMILIKPQFEAGKDVIVNSDELRKGLLNKTINWLNEQGHTVVAWCESPIAGKSGDKEFLCHVHYS